MLVLDGNDNVDTAYTWGLDLSGSLQGAGGVGGLLAAYKLTYWPNFSSYWFTYDGNGNVAQVLRNYSTVVTVAAHYEYDPYGNTIASPGDYADANPFRFSTKWLDSELASWTNHGAIGSTGLYYYGYRYYSPRLGRWVNRDPIGEDGGLNLYTFVGNKPILMVDAWGLRAIVISVQRGSDGKHASLGTFEMSAEGFPSIKGYTLELIAGTYNIGNGEKTYPIPAGKYKGTVEPKHRRGWVIRLHDVPGFEGILIHSGNYVWDTEGCILVGSGQNVDVSVPKPKKLSAGQWRRFVELEI